MKAYSTLRIAEYKALSAITFSGKVIDLGGDKKSDYQKQFKGQFDLTTLNYSKEALPDIYHDLEKPLPLTSDSFDGAALINVLEHIYHARELVFETYRILRKGGKIVIAVPFLFPIHPSPRDFWRFTDMTLRNMLGDAGFKDIVITPLAAGVFSARLLMIERLLPGPVRFVYGFFGHPFVRLYDFLFSFASRILGKKYTPNDYPLGYVVTASK